MRLIANGVTNLKSKTAITGRRGQTTNRKYLIRWKGYTPDYDTWELRVHIHSETIRDYELANGVYVHNWSHRCVICNLPFNTQQDVKIHKSRMHKEVPAVPQSFKV